MVYRERPDGRFDTCALIHRQEQLLDPGGVIPPWTDTDQQGHRRTGAGQERAEHGRIVERQRLLQQRHHGRTRRLVPTVLYGFAQSRVVAMLQRMHERHHALQVENRIAPRHRVGQRRARLRRR